MLTAMLISAALILLTLTVHYLVLREVSVKLIQWGCPCYRGLTLAVVSITVAHIFEAGAFAVGFWFADKTATLALSIPISRCRGWTIFTSLW